LAVNAAAGQRLEYGYTPATPTNNNPMRPNDDYDDHYAASPWGPGAW
jgi:hypothetical protein